jgi:hypothetical protein
MFSRWTVSEVFRRADFWQTFKLVHPMLSSCTIPSSLLLSLRALEWIDRQILGFLSEMKFDMTFLPEFCTSGFSNTYLRIQWIF